MLKLYITLFSSTILYLGTQAQCGVTAEIRYPDCNLWATYTDIPWYYIEVDVSAGTPPFAVKDQDGDMVDFSLPSLGTYILYLSPSNVENGPFIVEDGNGCITSNFPQTSEVFVSPNPGVFSIPYPGNQCPFDNSCVSAIDGGFIYDPATGHANVRINRGPPHAWEFGHASDYSLSGPVSMSGSIASLPDDVIYPGCSCTEKVLPDLPPGNYTLTTVNNSLPSYVLNQFGSSSIILDCSFGIPSSQNFTVPQAPFTLGDAGVNVTPRIALQGAMPSSGTLMDDDLRAAGMLPLTEPYSALGYTYSDPASAGASVPQSMFNTTGNDAVVDWVIVELREDDAPHGILASRPALVQRDGDVVDLDGDDYVNFPTLIAGNYRVAVRHRNHLGAMDGGSAYLHLIPEEVNLRSGSHYGTDATTTINGVECLWAGNVNFDDEVAYTGLGNDRDPILVSIGGSVPTNTTIGYSTSDVNMDGTIQYTGLENDRDPILVNIGGSVPTNIRHEQLP